MGFIDRLLGSIKGDAAQRRNEKYERKYGLDSGSTSRDDERVSAGWASMRGKRDYNEDTLYCTFERIPDSDTKEQVGCFGVFDGHGGPAASLFVRDHLFKNLLQHEAFQTNTFKAFEDAYAETDAEYVQLDAVNKNDDGCTAITAVLIGRRLVVAHVGDSRAVLAADGRGVALSNDHKPNREDERDRIENTGGVVAWAGTWRVSGVLAVSRSFGNRQMKTWVIPQPELREEALEPKRHSALVLASDGLWDVVTNDEAAILVSSHTDAEAAARALVTGAYERGSMDNISVVVVLFNFPQEAAAQGAG